MTATFQSRAASVYRTAIERAASIVSQADALVIAAGAGMGVDAGLPDFRGNAGFWRAYPALARHGTAFMDIASPAAFRETPRRAWGFYGHRLALYRATLPHAGFRMLCHWGEALQHGVFVHTSNVDGLFQKAGFNRLHIEECHGSLHHFQCQAPCSPDTWTADAFNPVVDVGRCELVGELPVCPHCRSVARPNVLMFDDRDWIAKHQAAQSLRRQSWLEGVRRPVIIEIGAGLNIPNVRHFAQRLVHQHNGALIRINPHDSHVGALPGVGIANGALQTIIDIDAVIGARRRCA